jgi:hypothetical protein
MYKIIGANQVEYGPISAGQLRQWIAEGRVNAQTLAQAEGETTWRPISTFPEFAASFASTPPPPPLGGAVPNDAGRQNALREVSGPAIGLIVAASLGILMSLFQILVRIVGAGVNSFSRSGQNPDVQRMVEKLNGTEGVIVFIFAMLLWGFVLYGGIKMKNLERYGICVAASIIAMIPCLCPCCVIGIPFGIWALIVLNKPEVKPYFS